MKLSKFFTPNKILTVALVLFAIERYQNPEHKNAFIFIFFFTIAAMFVFDRCKRGDYLLGWVVLISIVIVTVPVTWVLINPIVKQFQVTYLIFFMSFVFATIAFCWDTILDIPLLPVLAEKKLDTIVLFFAAMGAAWSVIYMNIGQVNKVDFAPNFLGVMAICVITVVLFHIQQHNKSSDGLGALFSMLILGVAFGFIMYAKILDSVEANMFKIVFNQNSLVIFYIATCFVLSAIKLFKKE